MRQNRTREELEAALNVQRQALTSSCNAFDEGAQWEALRLATAVFNLVHDGGRQSLSILTQLGVRDSISYLASGQPISPNNLVSSTPLVIFQVGGDKSGPIPRLDQDPVGDRMVSFKAWWEREGIYRAGAAGRDWYRKNLVFSLRNQDGGSHFDRKLTDPDYMQLKAGAGWIVGTNGQEGPMSGLEFATMRQIAYELMKSLDEAGL